MSVSISGDGVSTRLLLFCSSCWPSNWDRTGASSPRSRGSLGCCIWTCSFASSLTSFQASSLHCGPCCTGRERSLFSLSISSRSCDAPSCSQEPSFCERLVASKPLRRLTFGSSFENRRTSRFQHPNPRFVWSRGRVPCCPAQSIWREAADPGSSPKLLLDHAAPQLSGLTWRALLGTETRFLLRNWLPGFPNCWYRCCFHQEFFAGISVACLYCSSPLQMEFPARSASCSWSSHKQPQNFRKCCDRKATKADLLRARNSLSENKINLFRYYWKDDLMSP